MSTEDLIAKLEAAIGADEQWAIAASTDNVRTLTTGHHWQWICSNCDTPAGTDPMLSEFAECPSCRSCGVSLRSVERFPAYGGRELPSFGTGAAEEVGAAVAAHIARHDPARVLRDVAAHREILKWAQEAIKMCTVSPGGVLSQPGEHMMGDIGRWNIEALAKAYGIDDKAQTE